MAGICVRTLQAACERKMEELANTIEGEMKGVVGGHTRSGLALAAIHIEGGGTSSRFIGGTGGEGTRHLYWLDSGNGGSGGRITPKSAKALYVKDYGIWRKSVSSYAGIHFVREIANRHR